MEIDNLSLTDGFCKIQPLQRFEKTKTRGSLILKLKKKKRKIEPRFFNFQTFFFKESHNRPALSDFVPALCMASLDA
jgi:hypothetical protein